MATKNEKARWSLVVSTETDRALRAFLGQRGSKQGDLSRFVEDAVLARLYALTVEDARIAAKSMSEEEGATLVRKASEDARLRYLNDRLQL